MNVINTEIIGNAAIVYMKDGTIKNGQIMGFRSNPFKTELEFATMPANDPYERMQAGDLTELLDAAGIQAIDPYCK